MPRSYRYSLQVEAGADKGNDPRDPARDSKAERPSRHVLVLLAGILLVAALSGGQIRLPWPPAEAAGYKGLATAAFETALAAQLGTARAEPAAATFTPIATMAPPTSGAPAVNPWAVEIPEAACIPSDLPQIGRVVEVVDGDTIRVLLDSDSHVYSVRYVGVDAPEVGTGNAPALEALRHNTGLVYNQRAVLVRDISDADGNGALLRYVMVDGVFVNHELVLKGLAQAEAAPPDTACEEALRSAELRAQASGLGLWAAGGPDFMQPATPTP